MILPSHFLSRRMNTIGFGWVGLDDGTCTLSLLVKHGLKATSAKKAPVTLKLMALLN